MRHKVFNTDFITSEATKIFWQKGYHQTSIQDLVQISGFNRAGLYDSYGDKKNLFITCFIKFRDEALSEYNAILNNDNSTKKAFDSLFKFISNTYFEDSTKKGCLICNTYVEFLPTDDISIKKLIIDTRDMFTNIISKKLKHADKNNELNKEINHENFANTIYSSMVGVAVLSKTNIKREYVSDIFSTYLNIFV